MNAGELARAVMLAKIVKDGRHATSSEAVWASLRELADAIIAMAEEDSRQREDGYKAGMKATLTAMLKASAFVHDEIYSQRFKRMCLEVRDKA